METDCHVRRMAFQALVVRMNVGVQQSLMVDAELLHSCDHGLRAEVCQKGIVELYVTCLLLWIQLH